MNKIFLIFVCVFLFFIQACQTTTNHSQLYKIDLSKFTNRSLLKNSCGKTGDSFKFLVNEYAVEAKKRGLICSYANMYNDWEVCYYNFYKEQKRRGLKCTGNERSNINKPPDNDFSNFDDKEICRYALNPQTNKFEENEYMSMYVSEAKQRGLDCGTKKNVISILNNDDEPLGFVNENAVRVSDKEISNYIYKKDENNFIPYTLTENAFSHFTDNSICFHATINNNNKPTWNFEKKRFVNEAKKRGLTCGVKNILVTKQINNKSSKSSAELEKERAKRLEEERKRKALEKEIAKLKNQNKQFQKLKKIKQKPSNEIGSGFYVSKFRHIVTNQHVVNKCNKITVGESMTKQIPAELIASDKRNDLAILQTVSMEMASAETKSFLQKLSIEIVPIISGGLMRSEDVSGGEEILVAGYPLGNMVSDTIKVTKGIVSATKGMDNDVSQFEIDAVIRKGNSGGPVYDKRGNIVGVAVSRLNINKAEYVNFGIKGSTVKQFLSAHDVPTKWSSRKDDIDTKDIYKIASKQTVMVVCHR